MKCKSCKNEVPDGSLFCNHCGKALVKTRVTKNKPTIPKPRQLKNNEWLGQVMIDGVRHTVKAPSYNEYVEKVEAIKTGYLTLNKNANLTLRQVIKKHIDENLNVLSPETIRTYETILEHRFKRYMSRSVSAINYQSMVNDEALLYAPKTVSNSWGLVTAALNTVGVTVPKVNLPRVPHSDKPFLDYEEITAFRKTIKGRNVELAALLALHSLRVSEIIDLDVSQIRDGNIYVRGATIRDQFGKNIHRDLNKTDESTRTIPVLIDRVYELLPEMGKAVTCTPNTILKNVKKACRDAGVTECGTHDLRRSFCSLAFYLDWNPQTTMQVGGWTNMSTVNDVYRKLSQGQRNADIEKMRAFYNASEV